MNPAQQKKSWSSALAAFANKKAGIMFLLGFSAGIPIFLIFATLSFWLVEAGITRSTVTMFSWAALGYSFKWIWAPLVDKLPLPILTRLMGQRRSWLLLAQIFVIIAISLMAMTNPSPDASYFESIPNVTLMAMAAVFLGFSSATQDIVIDAYRIELSDDADLQTVLASTYNAGYRIATIITQMGALLFAASLGTAVGNYIYEAWQTTYLVMAGLMLVGVATTLCIKEPQVQRSDDFSKMDYFHLIFTFVISTVLFVFFFYHIGEWISSTFETKDSLLKFLLVVGQFLSSLVLVIAIVYGLIKTGFIRQQVVVKTWVQPLLEFFKRYGVKIALAILLLIGFYRISDIVAGTIANLFYIDLNFDKDEIAWFNKFFAVGFVILGGFIGGLLAQRFNIMKMMLLGAIVASTTNLIFVGLVKSGAEMQTVNVQVAGQQYQVQPDEVGKWSLKLKQEQLAQLQGKTDIVVKSQPKGQDELTTQSYMQLYKPSNDTQLVIEPIAGNDVLYKNQLARDVIVKGSIINLPEQAKVASVQVQLNATTVDAKVDDKKKTWSAVVKGESFNAQQNLQVVATYDLNQQKQTLTQQHGYSLQAQLEQPNQRIHIDPLSAVNLDESKEVELKGKVVVPYSKVWLVAGIIFDNLASGLAGAVFIAFLSSLTSVSFTAMQYALFTSLMLLLPKTIGGYSGAIVDNLGYSGFFSLTFLMGVPIFLLVVWVARLLSKSSQS